MRLLIPEIFDKLADATPAERAEILKKHDTTTLRDVLRYNFDPNIQFDLPKGAPPYKPSPHPVNMAETNFFAEQRRMYLLIKGHPRRPVNLKRIQIENIFIQMLEGINAVEAEMLIALKDKALAKRYKGLTESVVKTAFPGLLPEPSTEKP
jgi:hypothetical protein